MTLSTKAASLQQLFIEDRVGTVDAAVLAYLMDVRQPLTRERLAEDTDIKQCTLCGALDRLMRRGLIEEAAERVYLESTNRRVKAYQPKEHHETQSPPAAPA